MTQSDQKTTISINGEIDESGAEQLKSHFSKINLSTTKEVALDFSQVSYIGSSGIGKLLLFYKNLAVQGGKIRIENVNTTIYQLFQELKLNNILTITKGS